MMLKTGNKSFTLIEILISAVVLSVGTILIYESFFKLIDVFSYYRDYLEIHSLAENKIWEAQEYTSRNGPEAEVYYEGTFSGSSRDFLWKLQAVKESAGSMLSLYKINLNIEWNYGQKKKQLFRQAYALHKEKKKL